MKIKVAKLDLEDALRVVSQTVSGDDDISGHYLFRPSETPKRVEILSLNRRVFSMCPMVAEFLDEEDRKSFTVEAKRVSLLLEGLKSDSTITFASNGGEVVVNAGRGKLSFSSLNPDTYPFWDEVFKNQAEKRAVLSAERLQAALGHAKRFIYNDESKSPQLCVTEIKSGQLYSTDLAAVSIIKMTGLEEATFRIFGTDLKAVGAYLSTFKTKKEEKKEGSAEAKTSSPELDVEVWESEKALFLRRNDGAIFGESKFDKAFPNLVVDWNTTDDFKVKIAKEEVSSAAKFLRSAASYTDDVLKFDLTEDRLVFRMTPANGKKDSLEVEVPFLERWETSSPDRLALPEGGFPVSNNYVIALLDACVGDTVQFGISRKAKTGWIRVEDKRGEDTYLTTVAWLKGV